MTNVWTGVYWPKCMPISNGGQVAYDSNEDSTDIHNNAAYVEPPSYCVRLWVFEMPDE